MAAARGYRYRTECNGMRRDESGKDFRSTTNKQTKNDPWYGFFMSCIERCFGASISFNFSPVLRGGQTAVIFWDGRGGRTWGGAGRERIRYVFQEKIIKLNGKPAITQLHICGRTYFNIVLLGALWKLALRKVYFFWAGGAGVRDLLRYVHVYGTVCGTRCEY